MGWRELSVNMEPSCTMWNFLRGWLLVALVSACAGWGIVDMTLSVGSVSGTQMATMGSVHRAG